MQWREQPGAIRWALYETWDRENYRNLAEARKTSLWKPIERPWEKVEVPVMGVERRKRLKARAKEMTRK